MAFRFTLAAWKAAQMKTIVVASRFSILLSTPGQPANAVWDTICVGERGCLKAQAGERRRCFKGLRHKLLK